MAASSVESIQELVERRTQLDALIADDPEAAVPPADQQSIEQAIADAVAILAGEEAPEPSIEEPTRAILAKDLRITADLVLRALQSHT